MSRNKRLSCVGAAIVAFGLGQVTAQVRLVADLHLQSKIIRGEPLSFHAVGDEVWIIVEDGLWRTDGTAAGTFEVARTQPTELASMPDGTVYFVMESGGNGLELHFGRARSSALRLFDIYRGSASSSPRELTRIGDGSSAQPYRVVFSAEDEVSGRELWVCDGTTASLFHDFEPGSRSGDPRHLTSDELIFACTAQDPLRQIFRTQWADSPRTWEARLAVADGMRAEGGGALWFHENGAPGWWAEGQFVPPVGAQWWWQPEFPTHLGGALAIGLPTSSSPVFELGVLRLQKDFQGWQFSYQAGLSGLKPELRDAASTGALTCFAATDASRGTEPWRINGSSVARLSDIENGSASSFPAGFTAAGAAIYFTARRSDTGRELWKTDGATTTLVTDFNGPNDGCRPMPGAAIGSTLVFARAGKSGWLYKSDGSATGTVPILPIVNPASHPDDFEVAADRLFFTASSSESARSLYVADGERVRWIRSFASSAPPRYLCRVGDKLLFNANGELWQVDDQGNSATQVSSLDARFLVRVGSRAVCSVGSEVWLSDGSTSLRVVDTQQTAASWRPFFAPVGTSGSFVFADDTLWVSDGSALGTSEVAPVSDPAFMTALGAQVVFAATTPEHGRELWRTDGTSAGTLLVADLASGSASSSPRGFAVLGDRVFFFANGDELWLSDGTASGTRLVKDLGVDPVSLGGLAPVGSRHVYFRASTPSTGLELWRSDGTSAGTSLVVQAHQGTFDGFETPLSEVDRYRWSMPAYRDELWFSAAVTDGHFELYAFGNGATAWRGAPGCGVLARTPSLEASDPVLGQTMTLACRNLRSGSVGLLFLGFEGRTPLAADCDLWFEPLRPTFLLEGWLQTTGTSHTTSLVLPDDAALIGWKLTLQALFAPSDAVRGFDASNAVHLVLGR